MEISAKITAVYQTLLLSLTKEQKNEIVTRSVLNNVFILHHFPVSVSHKQKKLAILVYHVTLIIFNGIHALSIGQRHAE